MLLYSWHRECKRMQQTLHMLVLVLARVGR